MANFQSLKKPLLSLEVEQAIKNSIADEIYKPGEKLPSERELVDQFQVSRVTVREALRNLQRSGLVTVKRGIYAGAYVSEPTADPITENFENLIRLGRIDYSHLIDARMYIEPLAAETAAKHRTREDISRLNELLDNATSVVDRSWKQARLTNVKFHCEVAKITRNPIIIFITESITHSCSELIIEKTSSKLDKPAIVKLIGEHHEILEAIIKQDARLAYDKTKQHLIETYITYSQVYPEGFDKEMDMRIRQNHQL